MNEINKNDFNFGVMIEDKPDPRDYKISQFIPGEDEIKDAEFMLDFPKTQIIINQGSIGACVGHAFIMAKQILEYMQLSEKYV